MCRSTIQNASWIPLVILSRPLDLPVDSLLNFFLPPGLYLKYSKRHIYRISNFQIVQNSVKVMVMETPSPQCVGREFVRQYYTLLHEAPLHLHRLVDS